MICYHCGRQLFCHSRPARRFGKMRVQGSCLNKNCRRRFSLRKWRVIRSYA